MAQQAPKGALGGTGQVTVRLALHCVCHVLQHHGTNCQPEAINLKSIPLETMQLSTCCQRVAEPPANQESLMTQSFQINQITNFGNLALLANQLTPRSFVHQKLALQSLIAVGAEKSRAYVTPGIPVHAY